MILPPWYYENINPVDIKYSKAIYTITTYDKQTGVERTFLNVREFSKAYKLHAKTINIDILVSIFKEKNKHIDVKYDRNALCGPYQVYDKLTKKIIIVNSIMMVSKLTSRTRSEIQHDLSRCFKYVYGNRWAIGTGTRKLDFDSYVNKPKPYSRILIVNVKTGEEIVANSIRHASKLTTYNTKTIRKNLNTGKPVRELIFRALD